MGGLRSDAGDDAVVNMGLRKAEVAFRTHCTPSCASNLLPGLLRDYQERYPNITLEVREAYAIGMYDMLRQEEADIAIGPIDRGESDFTCRKLQDDP